MHESPLRTRMVPRRSPSAPETNQNPLPAFPKIKL